MKKLILAAAVLILLYILLKKNEQPASESPSVEEKTSKATEALEEERVGNIKFEKIVIPKTARSVEIYENLPNYVRRYIEFMEVDSFEDKV